MPARRSPRRSDPQAKVVESRLRVIGGALRGRTIQYNGDAGLRPMKDRVREAVFNLVGPRVRGKHVLDLFAGTGAMAIESLSRGADRALLIERRFPNAALIETTAAALGLAARIEVLAGDTFIWTRKLKSGNATWLAFFCPPYELYQSRRDDMIELFQRLWAEAKTGSVFVVESDERFEPPTMLPAEHWDVRQYPPASIGILEKLA